MTFLDRNPWAAGLMFLFAGLAAAQNPEGVTLTDPAAPATNDSAIEVGVLGVPMRTLDGDGAWVSVVVEIGGASLVAGDATPDAVSAEMIVHAFDASGAVVDTAMETLRFARGEAVDRLARRGAKVVTGMLLPAGQYRVRALVRSAATGREGSAQTEIAVQSDGLRLIPPLVPEQAEPWVVVNGHRPEHAGRAPARPFFVRDRSYVPAITATAKAGSRLPWVLMGYGLAGAEDSIDAALIGPDGAVVEGVRLVLSPVQAARDGIDRILAVLPLPSGLADGEYRLNIETLNEEGEVEQQTASRFRIGAESSSPQLEVAIHDTTGVVAAQTAIRSEPELVPRISEKAVTAGYRAILARLETDDRATLVSELAALELSGAGGDRETGVDRVRHAEMPLVRRVARSDREALVPVLKLYHDLALEHRRLRHAYLMRNAIDSLREVAELYAPRNGAIGNRIVAARAFSSLGGHFQVSGSGFGRMLFEEALNFDPNHAAALLGLAAHPEKHGGPYEVAVRYLKRLVAAHPDNREGRLRLAINLLRSGTNLQVAAASIDAERELERLVRAPEADWIYVLAVQELVRLLMADGDFASALTLLERATERVPENQKLKIEHAFCLDRVGRRAEAQRILAALDADRTGIEPARGRYNQYPRQALAIDRRLLDEGVARRQGLLVRLAQRDLTGERRR